MVTKSFSLRTSEAKGACNLQHALQLGQQQPIPPIFRQARGHAQSISKQN